MAPSTDDNLLQTTPSIKYYHTCSVEEAGSLRADKQHSSALDLARIGGIRLMLTKQANANAGDLTSLSSDLYLKHNITRKRTRQS